MKRSFTGFVPFAGLPFTDVPTEQGAYLAWQP